MRLFGRILGCFFRNAKRSTSQKTREPGASAGAGQYDLELGLKMTDHDRPEKPHKSHSYVKSYRRQRRKEKIRLYLLITLLCVLIAATFSLFTEKASDIIQLIEHSLVREAAEKSAGKKLDDATVDKLIKTYKDNEKRKP